MSMERTNKLTLAILAYSLGTFLEFLDFALYASAATIFSLKFFSNASSEVALICSWGVFSVSFLIRPLGALILGPIGDKYGTKKLIVFSLATMSFSTVLIGLLPDYESIGFLAPLILVLLRLIQGLSVSIEYNGLGSYLINADNVIGRLGFLCSFTTFSVVAGLLFGGIILSLFIGTTEISEIPDWQWRAPYVLCGLVVGVAGIFLRLKISDMSKIQISSRINPVLEAVKNQKIELIGCFFITGFISISAYLTLGFLSTFLSTFRDYYLKDALLVCGLCGLVMLVTTPIGGYLSDRQGRLPFMKRIALISIFSSIISFWLIGYGDIFRVITGGVILSAITGLIAGPLPALVIESFKASNRYTASTLAYNAGVSWLGSTAPLVILLLMKEIKINLVPGIYLSLFSIFCYLSTQGLMKKSPTSKSLKEKNICLEKEFINV